MIERIVEGEREWLVLGGYKKHSGVISSGPYGASGCMIQCAIVSERLEVLYEQHVWKLQ
jgi:hypothetical protein